MPLIFEQQPKESDKAFAAFSVYLSLGPQRSLRAVARKLAKCEQLLKRWSAKFDWPGRVRAHGEHLALAEREATLALARGKAADWLTRQTDLKEREWEMHERCIAAARRALEAFMVRDKVGSSLGEIARILEVASKLGRIASGLATETVEHTGEVDVNFRIEVEAAIKKAYGHVVTIDESANQRMSEWETTDAGEPPDPHPASGHPLPSDGRGMAPGPGAVPVDGKEQK